jgi:hypothetical protein
MGKDKFAGRKHKRIQVSNREKEPDPRPRKFAGPAVNGDGFALHIDLRPCNVCNRYADCKKFRPARREI